MSTVRVREKAFAVRSIFDEEEVDRFFAEHGIRHIHKTTIYKYLIRNKLTDLSQVPNVPAADLALIAKHFTVTTSTVIDRQQAPPHMGGGAKLAIKLQDGFVIETVIIRHERRADHKPAEAMAAAASRRRDRRIARHGVRRKGSRAAIAAALERDTSDGSNHAGNEDTISNSSNDATPSTPTAAAPPPTITEESTTEDGTAAATGDIVDDEFLMLPGADAIAETSIDALVPSTAPKHNESKREKKTGGRRSSRLSQASEDGVELSRGAMSSLPSVVQAGPDSHLHLFLSTAIPVMLSENILTLINQYVEESESRELTHLTVCVSSQVGCKMGCTFCATGTMGWLANLTSGEICEQFLHALHYAGQGIRNVVFMGMGEPMDNYPAVLQALRTLHSAFYVHPSKVTVSTVGVVSSLMKLGRDAPDVNLAFSLHAPNQEVRLTLVPSARVYPLDRLMAAMKEYQTLTDKSIMIEYIVIKGINDSEECGWGLRSLLNGMNVLLNLIPYNPTSAGDRYGYESPDRESLLTLQNIVLRPPPADPNAPPDAQPPKNTIRCTVRWSTAKGREVEGACGQLALSNVNASQPKKGAPGLAPAPGIFLALEETKKERRRKDLEKKRAAGEIVEDDISDGEEEDENEEVGNVVAAHEMAMFQKKDAKQRAAVASAIAGSTTGSSSCDTGITVTTTSSTGARLVDIEDFGDNQSPISGVSSTSPPSANKAKAVRRRPTPSPTMSTPAASSSSSSSIATSPTPVPAAAAVSPSSAQTLTANGTPAATTASSSVSSSSSSSSSQSIKADNSELINRLLLVFIILGSAVLVASKLMALSNSSSL